MVSYIAALKFSERLAPTFGDTAPLNRFVAMLVIYIVTSFMIWTAFRLISGVIDKVKLEAFDKQLGAMFGFAKGVLLCVAVTFFAVTLLPPAQGEMIVGSQSGQYIVKLLNKADAVMPPELHQVIDPYLNQVQQRLNAGHTANWPSGGAAAPARRNAVVWLDAPRLAATTNDPTAAKNRMAATVVAPLSPPGRRRRKRPHRRILFTAPNASQTASPIRRPASRRQDGTKRLGVIGRALPGVIVPFSWSRVTPSKETAEIRGSPYFFLAFRTGPAVRLR